jgi:heme/copper-type cytochrome/quinol oxidase subunit 4
MNHLLTRFTAFALLIVFNACDNGTKNASIYVDLIDISIPAEFEQNNDIKQFIIEYQDFANEFNELVAEMIYTVGFDYTSGDEQINEQSLSKRQIKKIEELDYKQARLLGKRSKMLSTMNRQLPALTEPEQRALRGVIGLIDANIKRKTDNNLSENELYIADNNPENQTNNEYDEQTRQVLAEREADIQRLKESGQWEEPNQSANSNQIYVIVFLSFVGVFLLVFGLVYRKGKLSSSFSQPKRTSFAQGLSQMASEMKGNLEKMPFDQMKNDPNISEEDKKSLLQGEEYIMGLIGGKTAEQSVAKGQASHEENSSEEATPIMSHENLKELYDSELKASLEGIEGKRKEVISSFAIMFVLSVSVFLSFLVISEQFYLNVTVGFIFIIAAIVFFVKGVYRYLKFRNEYKSSVVKKVIQFINPKYLYDANKHISLNDFKMSKLGNDIVNKAIGDDYVCGKIDKTAFEFSELVAQNEYETKDSEGKKVKQTDTHFNGLFFLIDFNKHIQGETFVLPDRAERLWGKFGQNLQKSSKGDLVKLENPEFEKYFAVFSTNQTEARYILTPTMMEGMVNIRKKIGKNFQFSFIGERLYCGVEFNQALFEASIIRPVSFADVEFMHTLFKLIEIIINEMNLNTRIWTKV